MDAADTFNAEKEAAKAALENATRQRSYSQECLAPNDQTDDALLDNDLTMQQHALSVFDCNMSNVDLAELDPTVEEKESDVDTDSEDDDEDV